MLLDIEVGYSGLQAFYPRSSSRELLLSTESPDIINTS